MRRWMFCLWLGLAGAGSAQMRGDFVTWGGQLAVSGSDAVTLWDLAQGKPAQTFACSKPGPVSFTRTGKAVWLESGRLHQGSQSLEVTGKAVFLDGRELVVDGEWRTLAGLQPVAPRMELNPGERVVAISHDFAEVESTEGVRVIERESGRSARMERDSGKVAISPDQHWLARATEESVEVRELPSMQVRYRLDGRATGLAWRPDSAELATADGDGVNLWSLKTGQLLRKLERRYSGGVSYSPDGRFLAQGLSQDASVCLWDLANGLELALLASEGDQWVVRAADGRFDSNAKAEPYLLPVNLARRSAGLLPELLKGQ